MENIFPGITRSAPDPVPSPRYNTCPSTRIPAPMAPPVADTAVGPQAIFQVKRELDKDAMTLPIYPEDCLTRLITASGDRWNH